MVLLRSGAPVGQQAVKQKKFIYFVNKIKLKQMSILKAGEFKKMSDAVKSGLSYRNPYSKRARSEKVGDTVTEDIDFLMTQKVVVNGVEQINVYAVTTKKARFRVTQEEAEQIDAALEADEPVSATLRVSEAPTERGNVPFFDLEDLKFEEVEMENAGKAARNAGGNRRR